MLPCWFIYFFLDISYWRVHPCLCHKEVTCSCLHFRCNFLYKLHFEFDSIRPSYVIVIHLICSAYNYHFTLDFSVCNWYRNLIWRLGWERAMQHSAATSLMSSSTDSAVVTCYNHWTFCISDLGIYGLYAKLYLQALKLLL